MSTEDLEKIAYDVDEAVAAPPDEKKVDGLGMIAFVGPKNKAKAKQTKNYGHITSAEDYIDALKKIGIDAQPTDWVVYFPESKGKLKTEDLNKIDKMLEKLGEEDEETGWDRFENAAQTWDQVIETGAGDPTEEEEKVIMDLGYYGATINTKTIEGLKNGERYQESEFSLRSEFPGEGVNEKTFPSKDKLIAAAKEYSLGDKTGEHSWIDTGGVKWTVTGATVDEIFGKNSSTVSTNKVDEMLASFKSLARKIPSKLREAEAIGRKDGLIDYLKGVVVIGGEGSIDLNNNKTLVQIAVVHDGSGYTPGAAIAVDQNRYHDLENDLLETCFEILKEEAMKDAAYIKELQKDYGDRWEEVLTETYDGKVWNLSVSDAVEAIKTNKYASKYIEIVEVEPQESKTLKSVDEMLAKLQPKNEESVDKGTEMASTKSRFNSLVRSQAQRSIAMAIMDDPGFVPVLTTVDDPDTGHDRPDPARKGVVLKKDSTDERFEIFPNGRVREYKGNKLISDTINGKPVMDTPMSDEPTESKIDEILAKLNEDSEMSVAYTFHWKVPEGEVSYLSTLSETFEEEFMDYCRKYGAPIKVETTSDWIKQNEKEFTLG